MKNLTKYLSKNCLIAATMYFIMFLVMPIKIVVILTIAYIIAHSVGALKMKFPDTWDLEENDGDVEKSHRVFLTVPTSIGGKWYIFCYIHKVTIDGVTSLSFEPIEVQSQDTKVQDETIN